MHRVWRFAAVHSLILAATPLLALVALIMYRGGTP